MSFYSMPIRRMDQWALFKAWDRSHKKWWPKDEYLVGNLKGMITMTIGYKHADYIDAFMGQTYADRLAAMNPLLYLDTLGLRNTNYGRALLAEATANRLEGHSVSDDDLSTVWYDEFGRAFSMTLAVPSRTMLVGMLYSSL